MASSFESTMNGSDTIMWSIEVDPALTTTVTAVALLDSPPSPDELRARLHAAIDRFPRLRQRVEAAPLGLGHPRWVEIPELDLDQHLKTVDAAGASRRWLLDQAAAMAEVRLDRRLPLWQFTVFKGLESGESALVMLFHHSLTDGVGGIEMMLHLVDRSRHPDEPPDMLVAEAPSPPSILADLLSGGRSFAGAVGAWAPALVRSAVRPQQTARNVVRTACSVTRLIAPRSRRRSPLFSGHSPNRHFDVHEVALADLRNSAAACEATINEVFVAAVAGALHSYHVKLGRPVHDLRVNMPVSFRRPGDPLGGNRFTPVRFVVPVDEQDPARRVRQVGTITRAWRAEPALPLTETVADVLSRLPDQLTQATITGMLYGVDFVATNVPGFPERCYIAGSEVLRQYAFSPLAGAAVNVSLVSHAGTACLGINVDTAAVSDPQLLAECVVQAFAEMRSLAQHPT